jgi:hypothetical protein
VNICQWAVIRTNIRRLFRAAAGPRLFWIFQGFI